MTNIRSSGFDSPAQLREHLAELEDDRNEDADRRNADLQGQISKLRTEVRQLRRLVVETRNRYPASSKKVRDDRFWLRLTATVAATFVLSAAVRYFRLGSAGAAAVPLIASKIRREGR